MKGSLTVIQDDQRAPVIPPPLERDRRKNGTAKEYRGRGGSEAGGGGTSWKFLKVETCETRRGTLSNVVAVLPRMENLRVKGNANLALSRESRTRSRLWSFGWELEGTGSEMDRKNISRFENVDSLDPREDFSKGISRNQTRNKGTFRSETFCNPTT